MKVVDSSGWLEFFTDGPLAEEYLVHLAELPELVTPSIVLYEVYKRIKRERGEGEALIAAAQLVKTRIVPLTTSLALTAADLSLSYSHDSDEHRDRVLALADRLRADGIDAHLDQYETSPAEGWPRWMRRQIRDAGFVLVVATAIYERRFEGQEEEGKGSSPRSSTKPAPGPRPSYRWSSVARTLATSRSSCVRSPGTTSAPTTATNSSTAG